MPRISGNGLPYLVGTLDMRPSTHVPLGSDMNPTHAARTKGARRSQVKLVSTEPCAAWVMSEDRPHHQAATIFRQLICSVYPILSVFAMIPASPSLSNSCTKLAHSIGSATARSHRLSA